MAFNYDAAADFGTSFVVLTTLAWWYGAFRRKPFDGALGAVLMGGAFGLVAVLQMHAPIEPADGMIVDLRVVPVALAGAYLGSSGLLICLLCAVSARLAIGGVGTEAGVAAILIAGIAGLGWSALTSQVAHRNWRHFLALGAAASLSLLAGVLLPSTLALWFFTHAAPVVGLAYLTVIPLVGHLLEKARIEIVEQQELNATAEIDRPSGLINKVAFARHVAGTQSMSSRQPVTAVLILRVRHQRVLCAYWGAEVLDQILCALRLRLGPLLRSDADLGRAGHGEILVGLTPEEAVQVSGVDTKLLREVCDRAVNLPGGHTVRVGLDTRFVAFRDPASQEAVLADLAPPVIAPRPFRANGTQKQRKRVIANRWSDPDHDRLFMRLDGQLLSDD